MSTTSLWTRDEVISITQGTVLPHHKDHLWAAQGVSIDSRTLAQGDLFIALTGPNHDAHDHLEGAFKAGAVAALVHKKPQQDFGPCILVQDTTLALEQLGRASRMRSSAKIAAITGSVGKTGTKEMLSLVLKAQAPTHSTMGNLNNQLGVPLSLSRMPRETAYGVFELGMNHAGELTELTHLVKPDLAIITAIELVHSEFFDNAAQIADAKSEIFLGVVEGGTAILTRDSSHFERLRRNAKAAGIRTILTFGSHIESHARLLDFELNELSTSVLALINDTPIAYTLGAVGKQWAQNSLAVLLAVECLGGNVLQAAQTLAELTPPKGRGSRFSLPWGAGHITVIDESYNASPASIKATLATLGSIKASSQTRRIAVLGDMLELGEQSTELHLSLSETLEHWSIDQVFTAGPQMAHLFAALKPAQQGAHAANSDAIIAPLLEALRPGDVVMIKGSAGSRMSKVIDALRGRGNNHAV